MNKKGVAFLTTIILLGLVVIASAALSIMLLRDAFIVKRARVLAQEYYLAEAGIEAALEALWSNDFDTSNIPSSVTLGAGKATISVDNTKYSSDKILLIKSSGIIGTEKKIRPTILIQVKENPVPRIKHAILTNGKIKVKDGGVVNCEAGHGIHSNSDATGGSWWSAAAVEVGSDSTSGTVNGASCPNPKGTWAVGKVIKKDQGTITGTIRDKDTTPPASTLDLPLFNDNFFNWYLTHAHADDIYEGNQVLSGTLEPTNGIIYVKYKSWWNRGNVYISGPTTLTGCIVAEGGITVNFFADSSFTHVKVNTDDGDLPALIAKGGNVSMWDPCAINGLIYANNRVIFESYLGESGNQTLNGVIIAKGNVNIENSAVVTYVYPMPVPGLPIASPPGWILNWGIKYAEYTP